VFEQVRNAALNSGGCVNHEAASADSFMGVVTAGNEAMEQNEDELDFLINTAASPLQKSSDPLVE